MTLKELETGKVFRFKKGYRPVYYKKISATEVQIHLFFNLKKNGKRYPITESMDASHILLNDNNHK